MSAPGAPDLGRVEDHDRRRRLGRRAQQLAAASVVYNLVESVIAIGAGLVAGSIALVGFGLDSIVEISSGLIILWKFRHPLPESRERQALRLMAISFFALAGYVTVESLRALLGSDAPEGSALGIALAAASLVIMPFLSWAQRRTGRTLGSNAVVADSTQTLLCTYLSAVLLAGLLLNATLGWSWADPIAGLVIAAVAVREGRAAWRGEGCACGPAGRSPSTDRTTASTGECCDGCRGEDVGPGGRTDGLVILSSPAAPASTTIEVLHVPDCPNLVPMLDRLREVTDTPVTTRVVDTPAEAAELGMSGSPTVLIDGVDPFTPDPAAEGSISCRIYRDAQDRIVPVPSAEQLRGSLLSIPLASADKNGRHADDP